MCASNSSSEQRNPKWPRERRKIRGQPPGGDRGGDTERREGGEVVVAVLTLLMAFRALVAAPYAAVHALVF